MAFFLPDSGCILIFRKNLFKAAYLLVYKWVFEIFDVSMGET
jgi:hypothetical protein